MLTVSQTIALFSSKIEIYFRPQVVFDAYSSKAVVLRLMLLDSLFFLPFLFCLVIVFCCKVLVYNSC